MSIPFLPEALSGTPVFRHQPNANVAPPVHILFIEDLSKLLRKTPNSIRTFATNQKYKHLIPRPFKMPHSRRLCWYEHEVLEWIESTRPAIPPPPRRSPGRPTKLEQLERQRWAATQNAGG